MKMAAKAKSVSKPDEKIHYQQNNLSHLAKAIMSNAGVGIYIVQHSKFVYVSQLYQKLTGYSEAELIGTYSFNNIYPDDREMVREEAIKCLKEKRFEPYEYRFVNKKDEVMWVLETITPLCIKGNEPRWEVLWILPNARRWRRNYATRNRGSGLLQSNLQISLFS
jgi:PAS domain S-box-containing protein